MVTYGEISIFWRHKGLGLYGDYGDINNIEEEKLLALEEKILEELRAGHNFGVDLCLACPEITEEGLTASLYFYNKFGQANADLHLLYNKSYSEKKGRIFGERDYPRSIL